MEGGEEEKEVVAVMGPMGVGGGRKQGKKDMGREQH